MPPTRRRVAMSLLASAAASPFLVMGARGQGLPAPLVPTPSCADDDDPTPAETEGPYFTANSPLRQDFGQDGSDGEQLIIGGMVVDTDCQPISGVMLELWHADADGAYDNEGYRYRGHSFSDERGQWWFETIVPGLYTGRTRHYHIKVQHPRGQPLTTQLYFPEEPGNERDGIFDPALLLRLEQYADERYGLFDFVVV